MRKLIIGLIQFTLLLQFHLTKTKTIKSLIQLVHFGSSTPSRIYHNETSTKYDWISKYGLSELTPVGKRQMYLLGLQIKRNYSTIFSKEFNNSQVYFRTSGRNVSYHSIQILSNSIFKDIFQRKDILFEDSDLKNAPPFKIDSDITKVSNKDPIPKGSVMMSIARKSRYSDELLELGAGVKCGGLNINKQSEEEAEVLNRKIDLDFTKKIIEDLNLNIPKDGSMLSCFKLSKFIYSNYYSNPDWNYETSPGTENWGKLQRCYQASSVVLMGNEESMEITGSPLIIEIKNIIENQIKKLKNKEQVDLKYSLFMGGEQSFAKTLLLMGLFDRDCIIKQFLNDDRIGCLSGAGFGTTLNYEIFQEENKEEFFLNVKYKGTSRNICGNKPFLDKIGMKDIYEKYNKIYNDKKEEEYYCEVEDFIKILEKRIVNNWEERCGIKDKANSSSKIYSTSLLLFLGIGNILMMTVLYFLYNMKKRNRRKARSKSQENSSVGDDYFDSDSVEFFDDNLTGYASFDIDESYRDLSSSLGGKRSQTLDDLDNFS